MPQTLSSPLIVPALIVPVLLLTALGSPAEGRQHGEPVVFTEQNFAARVLDYEPERRDGISRAAFEKGLFYLEETRAATESDPANLNLADYWNITMAFLQLGEPPAHVRLAFLKAAHDDPSRICAYISALGSGRLEEVIPETFLSFYEAECVGSGFRTATLDLEAYIDERALSGALVREIHDIALDDQRFRQASDPQSIQAQSELDRNNLARIDALFERHGVYIGRSMVGASLEHVMWSVIQHSDPPTMARYLPVVHAAVRHGELRQTPLKLLIDRLYAAEYGHQIFGSQSGVALAEPEIRARVRSEYGLD